MTFFSSKIEKNSVERSLPGVTQSLSSRNSSAMVSMTPTHPDHHHLSSVTTYYPGLHSLKWILRQDFHILSSDPSTQDLLTKACFSPSKKPREQECWSVRPGADQSSKAAFDKSTFAKTCLNVLSFVTDMTGAHQSSKKQKYFRARFGTCNEQNSFC